MVFTYPKVEKSDFVEDFHGEKIADPFSPLEEPDAEITKKFVTEQNEVFQVKKWLDELHFRRLKSSVIAIGKSV